MRVAVTGGRHYANREYLYSILDDIHSQYGVTLLIHGACVYGGADILAEDWAKDREVPYFGIPAKWKTGTRGKGEGMARNAVMLDTAKPDILVAFPGGNGTNGCCKEAEKRRINIHDHRATG